jgi:hypothetical protein
MNEEERERTMNFILEQQAHFAAGMDRLEEADARANRRLDKLERNLIRMAVQFRRERKDLRERVPALVDAQVRWEDKVSYSEERLSRLERITERSIANTDERLISVGDRMLRLEELTERSITASERRLLRLEETMELNIASSETRLARIEDLTARNSEDIRRNSEDIRALTKFVSRDGRQNGGADEG